MRTKFFCLLIVLLFLGGCTYNLDLTSSAYEESRADVSSKPSEPIPPQPSSVSDEKPESAQDEQTPEERFAGKNLEQILTEVANNFVTYYGGAASETKNLSLLEKWIEKYRNGENATVCLLLDGLGFPSAFYVLESDGTEKYTIYSYSDSQGWKHCESSRIIKREIDYLFASDLPAEEWYGDWWQSMVVTHTPIVRTEADYSVKTVAPLGEITPEEAGEIAVLRFAQFYTYAKKNASKSFFAAGQYFPLDIEPLPDDELFGTKVDLRPVLAGTVEVNGHPCYCIGVALTPTDQGEGNKYVVNADGGNLVFSISAESGSYSLEADSLQEIITPKLT